ncbi:hypothetical protein QU24_23305 [Pantoea rodasii]|uniref:DUF3800 domain-containing protein n=1 Tax=Pantoea rodasii TaxID=1076549 RepID=A0A0B1QY47_9GAMM|nr:DUF3800 domain-containing protein [Pantoea rodasii]KHJ65678.1 hypothetical protein QU24_23305 [Pantoea rodasii]
MKTFAMDESGYTGYDLLHKSQPWQGAVAVDITHEEAENLIRRHFPKLQATELKFSKLKRRPTNQKALYNLQQDVLNNFPCVTCVSNKRYMLILMFIDHAVEPSYHDKGFNLYKHGGNHNMASLMFYAGPAYFGRDFEAILEAFQFAMREKSDVAIEALISSIWDVGWQLLKEVLGPLALGHPACINAILNKDVSTDASLILLQSVITRTEIMTDGIYRIEHDRSENLRRYNEHLSFLIGCKMPAEFRQSDIASIRFPLKLTEVYQVDSKDSPAVQLCDILVGGAVAAAEQLMKEKSFSFYSPLKLYRDDQIIHFLPEVDFKRQREFRQGSQGGQLIDFLQSEFNRSRSSD